MTAAVDQLLMRYETGQISRRQLLGALTAIALPAPPPGTAHPAVGVVEQLNHVTVFVRDVERAVAFYQRLFGMPVLTPQEPGVNLRVGTGFFGIYPADGGSPGINHVCFGLKNFEADSILKKLSGAGVTGHLRVRGDTKELYFTDADNILVQLQDVHYRGGVGPLGDRDPK